MTTEGGEAAEVVGFPMSTTLAPYSFANCTSLSTFEVPYNLVAFRAYCFAGSGLTSFELPYYAADDRGSLEVTAYGIFDHAFENCTKLESFVSHGEFGSVMSVIDPVLGAYAFRGCTALKTVQFDDMYAIMDGAFENCTALETVKINFVYKNIVSNATDGLLIIASNAFANCSSITTLNITGALQSISANAFANCTSVANFTVPTSVTSIASGAFSGWTAEQNITVPFANADAVLGGWNSGWNGNATIVYGGAAA